jgi:hypothetical protein
MTDTLNRTEWHTTTDGPDAELAGLRRRLADAELRAMNAAAAEDTAQFAFETARRRADRAEAALQRALIDLITPRLPEALENSAEAIADDMVDDITTGTPFDELDLNGHIETRMEQR